jgi:3-phenylpropionate/trans-cinnamate dioxygenase ferredoxin reductase subunit
MTVTEMPSCRAVAATSSVELLLGRRACALDVRARRVVLDRGTVGYDALVVATGSRPRRLPALVGRPNVVELRTALDAARLRSLLVPGARLAIVGGGSSGSVVRVPAVRPERRPDQLLGERRAVGRAGPARRRSPG